MWVFRGQIISSVKLIEHTVCSNSYTFFNFLRYSRKIYIFQEGRIFISLYLHRNFLFFFFGILFEQFVRVRVLIWISACWFSDCTCQKRLTKITDTHILVNTKQYYWKPNKNWNWSSIVSKMIFQSGYARENFLNTRKSWFFVCLALANLIFNPSSTKLPFDLVMASLHFHRSIFFVNQNVFPFDQHAITLWKLVIQFKISSKLWPIGRTIIYT